MNAGGCCCFFPIIRLQHALLDLNWCLFLVLSPDLLISSISDLASIISIIALICRLCRLCL